MRSLKALAALLTYPQQELLDALPEVSAALIDERRLSRKRRSGLETLLRELAAGDLLELQSNYVSLFDRNRSLSLHLFEHLHGDSRARGAALVELGELYTRFGMEPVENELPDFLPLYLEFSSIRPEREACGHLGEVAHILEPLEARLSRRGSSYAAIFAALLDLADRGGVEVPPLVTTDEPNDSLAAIDAAWEEAAVIFGPEAAPQAQGQSCERTAAMLRRMQDPW